MLEQGKLDRINALAKKAKQEGLSGEEKAEQAQLRQEFLADFRDRFRQQLEQIEFVEEEKEKL